LKTDIKKIDPVNERCLILEWYLISNVTVVKFHSWVLGAFEKFYRRLWAPSCMSVCLAGCPSVWANSSPTENICTKFDIWEFL